MTPRTRHVAIVFYDKIWILGGSGNQVVSYLVENDETSFTEHETKLAHTNYIDPEVFLIPVSFYRKR